MNRTGKGAHLGGHPPEARSVDPWRQAAGRRLHHFHRFASARRLRRLAAALARPRGPFRETYQIEDNSHVVVYSAEASLFADYPHRKALGRLAPDGPQVSLIATAKDEETSVAAWAASLLAQSRLPDEVIVVDGGSSDATIERLKAIAAEAPFPFEILSSPGANIARGRNQAIRQARHPLIAVTDLGCVLDPRWLETLLFPFQDDPTLEVSAGWYRAAGRGPGLERTLWPALPSTRPQEFLPSSRSIAFRLEAWRATGGYPEWLTLTGEDTYFALELKKMCRRWAFVPEAVVVWDPPRSWHAYLDKTYRWSEGDGESSVHGRYYWREFLESAAWAGGTILMAVVGVFAARVGWLAGWTAAGLWLLPSLAIILTRLARGRAIPTTLLQSAAKGARILGFLAGARRRRAADQRRWSALDQVVFLLAGVPIDDTGGGARGTQLALELLNRNCGVVFIHRFPSYETVDLGLRIVHPNLATYSLADFRWSKLDREYAGLAEGKPLSALVEFPLSEFLPLVNRLRAQAAIIAYDCIDAWDTSLGARWFSPDIEDQIIERSRLLLATDPSLRQRLAARAGRSVHLMPNAVNRRLFARDRPWPRPTDLPEGDPILLYQGALWGDWFDWELLAAVVDAVPGGQVVLIGDYAGQCPFPARPNLHFLGLKPQRSLPAYLHYAHVGIIPWKVNPITRATSPLKVYEYLAMHCPVVAPDLPSLQGAPAVLLAADHREFLNNLERARRIDFPRPAVERFVQDNSWQVRVDRLFDLIAEARGGAAGPAA